MTSSPGPMPSARREMASASVPVPTPIAAGAWQASANSFSKASSSGPRTNQPRASNSIDGRPNRPAVLAGCELQKRDQCHPDSQRVTRDLVRICSFLITSATHRAATSMAVLNSRRKLKNCDLP